MLYKTVKSLELREAAEEWLSGYEFHFFVTLATNRWGLGEATMRRLYLQWDARVNRKLYGPKWQGRYAERLFILAALEKPRINPHWHMLVRVMDCVFDPTGFEPRKSLFLAVAKPCWKKVILSGDADIKPIGFLRGAVNYSVKQLCNPVQYESLIVPDQFFRR